MKKAFLLLSIIFISTNIFAQEEKSWGVTANIQSSQFEFLLPIWVSETATLSPSVSFIAAQEGGSDLSFGLSPKFYLSDPVEAVPFVSFRGGAIIGIPNSGDAIVDFLAGFGGGAEYFFNSSLSVGIELQGNFTFSDEGSLRFGNPGNVNFNTATSLTASIFF
tara:strand:- start:259064 stop:259552 length:489 start_codon:yes stop_codon:yes gene_type:complete